jgi:hypothetical protein
MGYRTSIGFRYAQRYGIWSNDMGDDSIDAVISHIDIGYLVTLMGATAKAWSLHIHVSKCPRDVNDTRFERPRDEFNGIL